MKISKQKYIEYSQAGFWFEILINGLFLISGIISNLLTHYNFIVSIVGIPLLLFNLLNIVLKLSLFFKKNPIENRKLYSNILLIFIILIFIFSFISSISMILRTLVFLVVYQLNLKYNYFIK
ncbi:MAG: hypothetical protein ACRCX7_13885 [Cetobacterium sp.]|uniref:hypothetical protein n=1 Tax=Cetobacterium sp. TaxID=2071632 RepID=UPI003F2C77F2